jgi:glycosyl-4,4'-diaponeurosporenoate acyltransferase
MEQLPVLWIVLLNAGAWLVIHLGVSWAATRLPARWLRPTTSWLFRQRRWEREGALYERLLAVHRWKRLLPDGAALFRRGFRKKRLLSRDPAYLRRFRVETARAELAHWVTMAFAPLFFLFNPVEVALFMPVYALLVNLPPIVAQRYNRCRFNELLGRLERQAAARTTSSPPPTRRELAAAL